MHTFDTTGVKVLQLESAKVTSDDILNKTEASVVDSGSLTAEELARIGTYIIILNFVFFRSFFKHMYLFYFLNNRSWSGCCAG